MSMEGMVGKTFKVTKIDIAAITLDNGSRWYNYPELRIGDAVKIVMNSGKGESLHILEKVN